MSWFDKIFNSVPKTDLYFECHITIEPVIGPGLFFIKNLASEHNFRVADLLMQKRPHDTPERSKFDTFMTGHSKDYRDIELRMKRLVKALQSAGYKVWRYKIENTIIDSRSEDKLGIL